MRVSKIKLVGIIFLLVSFSLAMTACDGLDDGVTVDDDNVSEYEILVYDETNDEPIEGADISLGTNTDETDSEGVATFEDIEEGENELVIDAPAYEDYSEYVEVSEETSPHSTYLELEIELADLPRSLVDEGPESTGLALGNTVIAQDIYDKDVGYMVLKSTANLYLNLLDEYNDWIENKINEIMRADRDTGIDLDIIVGGEYQEEWSYTCSDENELNREMLGVLTDESEHEINEGDNDSDYYENKYKIEIDIENEENKKGKLYFSDDYTRYNYLEETKLHIPQNGDDVVVDAHFQVIHDEVERFTVISFNVNDNVYFNDDDDYFSMEMNLFANIQENGDEKTVEFIYNEKDDHEKDDHEKDEGITANYVTKLAGIEADDNLTVGLNTWFEEIGDDNPDYAMNFVLGENEADEISDITLGEINDLVIYGFVDDIDSFPNEENDSPEHDFYSEESFIDQEGYPDQEQVDEISESMNYDINASDFGNPSALIEEMGLY